MTGPVLRVDNLRVSVGRTEIVHGVGFEVEPGGTLGIVGESGSGKSMSVLAATGLIDVPGSRVSGSSVLRRSSGASVDLTGASPATLRSVHGGEIGFVFQDPGTSLNPLLTIGRQISESFEVHRKATRRQGRSRAIELLEAVGMPFPEQRVDAYPHQLSGGQRQRAMIAIALACDPALLIADEPTTALDVTTQAQIIDLVQQLQEQSGTAVVWISHDLGVIGQVADSVLVLRDGRAVEDGTILDIYDRPREPYTRELLAARPRIRSDSSLPSSSGADELLTVEGLDVRFSISTPTGRRAVHAVDDVSLRLRRGTTLGLVGESGSGKSTIANVLTGLVRPQAGTASLAGLDVVNLSRRDRRRIAMVFQDPFASLDPRHPIGDAIEEPLRVHRMAGRSASGRRARVHELLDQVGLARAYRDRFPHELSGGQRQRVSIARALAVEPEIVILDEATSSLDVSIQARVLELLKHLQRELSLTYLFIAHDLAVVQEMCHDVVVLKAGRVVESAPAATIFAHPGDEYTRALLDAVPPERPA